MTDKPQSPHSEWSSRFAFILAATGSAVGLGNIWKFPYITGQNGGGAFVLIYLLCVLGLGIPIMIAEIMIGRRGRHNPINTLQALSAEAGADPRWVYLGRMGIAAGFLILAYYSVIAGWALDYIVKAFFGQFFHADATEINQQFQALMNSPFQQIVWHSLFMVLTMAVVVRGVKAGLEQAVRFLMPALFFLLLILVAYAMGSGAYQQGIHFLFSPDFSKINADAVLTAMGHAFFTLSLGMGSIMVYGSYLPGKVSIAKTTLYIAGADTIVALLAGIAIFPLVFANHLEAASGPGLIFQTLPLAFGSMTGGWLFGILFFVLLFFAALTSSISLIEPAVVWLVENRDMDRQKACIWSGAACWLLGVAVVFSFNIWSEHTLFGKNLFELLDYLTANLMLPLGGLGIAVFAGWVMSNAITAQELELPQRFYQIWLFFIKYIAPPAVFFVFLHVLGVLG
ncbi:sodium-dependent transporter [Methylomonas paludis]|uniref:Transporter n=1 Tax=Methylomonas paludis TaxID=1173101 RepID=A0A975MLQ8_9GAMM|nr:sodium-dependent transporter [Methylomonas paludis]QWF70122.1 sodium-dependent transporter [Methylomonas paludis]